MSPPDTPRRVASGLRTLARVQVGAVVALIALGGMVTSTGSGMAFADWPLANGSLWPAEMGLDGLFEHCHRILGALVGLIALTLAVWVGLRERRGWLRKLTVGALGLVVVQGILGGRGVLQGLPVANSVAHGVLAQLTLCTFVTVAFALSPAWERRVPTPPETARIARWLSAIAVVLIITQILVGAVARHGGSTTALWTHVVLAMAVALGVLFSSSYCSGRLEAVPGVRQNTRWILGILAAQLLLGFTALAVRNGKDPGNIHFLGRSALITSHVVVGSALALTATLLLLRVFRNLDAPSAVAAGVASR